MACSNITQCGRLILDVTHRDACYDILRFLEISTMPIDVENVRYWRSSEVCSELGISRQTLWRWRQQGKVPSGHRYRNNTIVFIQEEVEEIREFANRVEPLGTDTPGQLKLFNGQLGTPPEGRTQ